VQERRKLPRRHIMFYSRLFDLHTGVQIGFLLNIHRQGMMVLSDQPPQNGLTYRLRLDLPKYLFGKPFLHLNACCVWHRPDIDPNFYESGFSLENVSEDDAQIIEGINRVYELHDRPQPL
jgi:hypothetical protein